MARKLKFRKKNWENFPEIGPCHARKTEIAAKFLDEFSRGLRLGELSGYLLNSTPKLYLLLTLNMMETPFSVVVYLFLNHFRKLNRRKKFLKSQLAERFSAF